LFDGEFVVVPALLLMEELAVSVVERKNAEACGCASIVVMNVAATTLAGSLDISS
jgi:hypothetical protein